MMEKSCVKCGKPKAKGRHYVTIKVPNSTTQIGFDVCPNCGNDLSQEIVNTILNWRRKEK